MIELYLRLLLGSAASKRFPPCQPCGAQPRIVLILVCQLPHFTLLA